MYSIIHSIYISSHIIPHHYICYDKTGNKCNAGLTGRPVLYTEPINWPRVNFRNKKKKKKKEYQRYNKGTIKGTTVFMLNRRHVAENLLFSGLYP